jgi:hypothetical protein
VVPSHDSCPDGYSYAVVKTGSGELAQGGCYSNPRTAHARSDALNASEQQVAKLAEQLQGKLPHQLESWWEHGDGAKKIRWGTKGDFMRCVRLAKEHMPDWTDEQHKGFCNERHQGAIGVAPGKEHKEVDGEEFGGKPTEGTKADRRLKENKDRKPHKEKDEVTASAEIDTAFGWDGSASRFTDEQYRRAAAICEGEGTPKETCHLPHHEPGGAVSKDGVHAAAAGRGVSRLKGISPEGIAKAKAHLRGHYTRDLHEEPPDSLKAETSLEAWEAMGKGKPPQLKDCPPGMEQGPDGDCVEAMVVAETTEPTGQAKLTAPNTWSGPIVVEGVDTGDQRHFAENAITWADPPLHLRWKKEDSHGGDHDVTVTVGSIDKVWRDGTKIMASGSIDVDQPDGQEIQRRLASGYHAGGISIDADDITDADVEYMWPDKSIEDATGEVTQEDQDIVSVLFGRPEKVVFHAGRIRAATLVDTPAFVEARIALDASPAQPATTETLSVGLVGPHKAETNDTIWNAGQNDLRMPISMPQEQAAAAYAYIARIVDDTVAKQDAFFLHHEVDETGNVGPANMTACSSIIGLLADRVDILPSLKRGVYQHMAEHLRDGGLEPPPFDADLALVAHAAIAEWRPPREWFLDPELRVPTPILVSDAGRVYGHASEWGQCHLGYMSECVMPPFETEHPYYLTGEVVCADGVRVPVGQITAGIAHAPLQASPSKAKEHYEDTSAVVADVTVGNDRHGIWVAGAVRPTAESGRVHALRATGQVSPDWRRIGGQLRMVGLLAVTVSGYQVPRARAKVFQGEVQALVSSGFVTVRHTTPEKLAYEKILQDLDSRVHPELARR